MATKSISQLDAKSVCDISDLFEIAAVNQDSASGYISKKMSAEVIATALISIFTYPTALPNMQNRTIAGALNTLLGNLAEVYDDTKTYRIGAYCTYNGVLYRANTNISTAESFNVSHWDVATATDGEYGVNYSTSEHIIGTWIDGSILYEKTIEITPLTRDGSDVYVNHGISNIDLIVAYEGFFMDSEYLAGRCTDKNMDPTGNYDCTVWEVNRTQIGYTVGSGWDYRKCYVTIRYTKSS